MMRYLPFLPLFSAVDMLTATVTAILLWNGHWLASLPVAALGVALYAYGRRRMRSLPITSMLIRGRR